jgi:aspartyl-tRNA(Asn)/glutamyl-tRNA(Gln) amidotransferase subunit A
MPQSLWALTASELHRSYQALETDPVLVLDACLAKVSEINPVFNAIVALDRDGAMAAAEASRLRWQWGQPLGLLDGVPLTVKDNLYVRGLLATWGSLLFRDNVAPRDDLAVSRLRSQGAVIIGKTNTPELSLASYTDNKLFGATGNPWAPELSSGGSSGGAASAVMSGMGPLALVTDAGGSTRRPASHVGCVGLKPGLGRVPQRYGFPPLAADLQSIGLLARSVPDARAMFEVIADPAPQHGCVARALRIVAFAKVGDCPIEPEIEMLWRDAIDILAAMGHLVEEIEAPFDPDEMTRLLMGTGAAGVARVVRLNERWRDKVTPNIANLAEAGEKISAPDYVEMIDAIAAFRHRMMDLFKEIDLILTPTTPVLLWPKDEPYPQTVAGREAAPRAGAVYTTFVNVAGCAGLSLPAGVVNERNPAGIQLVGPAGSEELLLALGGAWEQARPWPTLAPLSF